MNKTNRKDVSIDTQIAAIAEPSALERTTPRSQDSGVLARATLVVVLSMTLVGAMRWALNITNANARQISTNLTRMQGHYDTQASASAPRHEAFPPRNSASGPLIEPDSR